MRMLTALLLVGLLLAGCRSGRWVWEDEVAVARCLGGKINTEKRTTDVLVGGRTRNTTIRTDACLD